MGLYVQKMDRVAINIVNALKIEMYVQEAQHAQQMEQDVQNAIKD